MEAVLPQSVWALRMDMALATSPELTSCPNTRASAEWDTSSPPPCTDDMQTDSPSCIKTPVPEGRHCMEMDTSPMPPPRAPRSPWKKHRRGEAELRFDDDIEADLIWTSGENFKFEATGGQDSPTHLSGEGRLSLGMLDLSGASEPNFGSECGPEERLDASALRLDASDTAEHSANTTVQCADTTVSPTSTVRGRRVKALGLPSPGRILNNSANSAGTNSSFNLSQMPTAAAVRDVRMQLSSTGSPLHPQRLFNPGAGLVALAMDGDPSVSTPVAQTLSTDMQKSPDKPFAPTENLRANPRGSSSKAKGATGEGSTVLSSADRSARRLSAPLMYGAQSSNQSSGRPRYNPFLPRTFSPGSNALTMGFFGDTSMPLTVRSFLEDFVVLNEIGRGSFGRVYSCRRKIDLGLYAVKEIDNEFRSERERERLLREIYALSTQGDNIHVVRYFSAWEQDDKLYIQTELCTGSLKDVRRRKGALHEDLLKDILVQVATGLAFMHAHNMAHLDVKPDNIYTTERGIYKLGDLGLASSASPRTHEDEGDKRYLSRELLQQQENCDLFKADIFALGVTMLEMASGVAAPAEGEEYHKLREGRVQMPGALSREFQELLMALLHVDAAWRPSARDIVRHPLLFALLRDESIACLRAKPLGRQAGGVTGKGAKGVDQQRTSLTLMESDMDPQLMLSVHSRALKAEKEAIRLRAALHTAQQEAAMLRERCKLLENVAPAFPPAACTYTSSCALGTSSL